MLESQPNKTSSLDIDAILGVVIQVGNMGSDFQTQIGNHWSCRSMTQKQKTEPFSSKIAFDQVNKYWSFLV